MCKLIIIFLLIIFNHNIFSQEVVHFYAKNGKKISVVLPNGYCKINKTNTGKYLIQHLNNTMQNTPALKELQAEAMVVFSKCNQTFDYPWGYIMLSHIKLNSSVTQLDVNKIETKTLNKKYLKKIKKQINKSHDLNQMEIQVDEFTLPEVVWEDENALLIFSKGSAISEGIKVTEEVTGSTVLHRNYRIYFYIVELEGEGRGLENAHLLLEAAKKTKKLY